MVLKVLNLLFNPKVIKRHNTLNRRLYCQLKNQTNSQRLSNSEETNKNIKFQMYGFGLAEHGALGLDNPNIKSKKMNYHSKPIRHYFAEENEIVQVGCGYGFTIFLLKDGQLFGSGINSDNQIGESTNEIVLVPKLIDIGLQGGASILSISAGRAHTAIFAENGIYMIGNNSYGQCGVEVGSTSNPVKNQIVELCGERPVDVVCGQDHTLFLTENGHVYSCGWGADGQTGQGITDNTVVPNIVQGAIDSENILQVACCSDTVLALSDNGEVFGWGSNEYMQLSSDKDVHQINTPIKLDKINNCGKIIDIAAGGSFCIALTCAQEVYVWGYGILGLGPNVEKSASPLLIPKTLFGCNEFQPNTIVESVHCGMSHMMAINNYGHVYSWGKNRYGCLGVGHLRDQYFPYKLSINFNAMNVSCGLDHTLVLGQSFK